MTLFRQAGRQAGAQSVLVLMSSPFQKLGVGGAAARSLYRDVKDDAELCCPAVRDAVFAAVAGRMAVLHAAKAPCGPATSAVCRMVCAASNLKSVVLEFGDRQIVRTGCLRHQRNTFIVVGNLLAP